MTTNRKRNVLIIAALYNSKRVLGLAKYLLEFGWQPTIVTSPVCWQPTIITPPSHKKPEMPFEIIETGYRDAGGFLRRLLKVDTTGEARGQVKKFFKSNSHKSLVDWAFNIGGMFLNYPDSHKGWKCHAIEVGDEIISNGGIDAMISICPITSHIIASKLKKRHNILWLADYPDLWSQNFNYSYGGLRRLLDRRLERKTMKDVDIVTTVSPSCVEKIGNLHTNKPTYLITLGYDPQDYDNAPVKLTSKFSITYTGLIYNKQNPNKLLWALADLFAKKQLDRNDCEIRFYGQYVGWLEKEICALYLSDVVHQYDIVPHSVVVGIQKRSQLLLLLDWEDHDEFGFYSAKAFEYLGARRPILAVGGVYGNAISKLLGETNAGIQAPTVEGIKEVLVGYYQEYKLKGEVAYVGKELEIHKYNQRIMAGKFAELLSGGV